MKVFWDDQEGYRKLLSSIIWLAVYDACTAPVNIGSKGLYHRPSDNAASAMRFLFDDVNRPYFRKYIECLGMDADTFRNKLIATMYSKDRLRHLPFGGLPDNAQKSFRFNHTYWLTHESPDKGDSYVVLTTNRRHFRQSTGQATGSPLGSEHGQQTTTDDYRHLEL